MKLSAFKCAPQLIYLCGQYGGVAVIVGRVYMGYHDFHRCTTARPHFSNRFGHNRSWQAAGSRRAGPHSRPIGQYVRASRGPLGKRGWSPPKDPRDHALWRDRRRPCPRLCRYRAYDQAASDNCPRSGVQHLVWKAGLWRALMCDLDHIFRQGQAISSNSIGNVPGQKFSLTKSCHTLTLGHNEHGESAQLK